MPLLPIGDYTIRVDSAGFGPVEQKDVRLQVDEHRELDFTLTPASVTSTVEVSATEVAVQTANPTSGSGHYLPAGRPTPSERPQLRAVGDADAGHDPGNQSQQLLQRRPQQRSLHPRVLLAFGGRIARPEHRLAAGRQRQQRTDRRAASRFCLRSMPFRNLRFSPTTTRRNMALARVRPCC